MIFDRSVARDLVESGNLSALFIEQMGWDRLLARLSVALDSTTRELQPIAQKRDFAVFAYHVEQREEMPDRVLRRKIEQQVARAFHEHLIVFVAAARHSQIWQWVDRRGAKTRFLEHEVHPSHAGEALLDKLEGISFELDEEASLTLLDVTSRVRRGFDREKVTRAFYDKFKERYQRFFADIHGIAREEDKGWYASVMLNRLMFVYFIQRKGFLDSDRDYLRNRLEHCRRFKGKDQFFTFYRHFLLRLFHEGLGSKNRSEELDALLGSVPYLNGGLFEEHAIERTYGDITIPDAAFEAVFDLFDQYEWYLDDRPLRSEREINPDVLGYIFEQFVNQKQMGAFYTRDDITDYMTAATLLPSILDLIEERAGHTTWPLVQADADRFLQPALQHGLGCPLPGDVPDELRAASATTIPPGAPPEDVALPSESWWEVIDRREWARSTKETLASGPPLPPDELFALGLDLEAVCEQAISELATPFEVLSVYQGLRGLAVLDPTVGSGAFLFAALRVLERVYLSIINRAAELLALGEDTPTAALRELVQEIDEHPSTDYFVKKVVLLENLFGVDLMEEAIEIARLRLFLALVAHVEDPSQIEPLPDLDLNLRSGNLLVGVMRAADAVDDFSQNVLASAQLPRLLEKADRASAAYDEFVVLQRKAADSSATARAKEMFLSLNAQLREDLDQFFYQTTLSGSSFEEWRTTHRPFHWLAEFPSIIGRGGFSVVLGNPPYVASHKVSYAYGGMRSAGCPDIYAPCIERAASLLAPSGRFAMIVPISLQYSLEYETCRAAMAELLPRRWTSTYSRNPSALFSAGLGVRNTILIGCRDGRHLFQSAALRRWHEPYRPFLFATNRYSSVPRSSADSGPWPRLGHPALSELFERLSDSGGCFGDALRNQGPALGFKNAALYYISVFVDEPPAWDDMGNQVPQTNTGVLRFESRKFRDAGLALLSGRLALWWWAAMGSDFTVSTQLFAALPVSLTRLPAPAIDRLAAIGNEIRSEQPNHPLMTRYAGKDMGNFDMSRLRYLTDVSDDLVLSEMGLKDLLPALMLADARLSKVTGERPGTRREWPRSWERLEVGSSMSAIDQRDEVLTDEP